MAWFVAGCIVLGSVVAVVAVRRLAGVVATRVLGGALFLAALAAILSYYQTYWLEGRFADHLQIVAPAVGLIGLAAVLFAGQSLISFGGVSCVAGLLAAGAMATAAANLPEIGSYERADLRVGALALAFVAVGSGIGAIGTIGARRAGAAAAVVGAVLAVVSGYDAYPVYGEPKDQATSVGVTVAGIAALLALAVALVAIRTGPPMALPETGPEVAFPEPSQPPPTPSAPRPDLGGRLRSAPAGVHVGVLPARRTGRSRLEVAATVVGLITGIIVLVRELLGLIHSLGM